MIKTLSCEAYEDLRRGGADYLLIDVRDESEWNTGHLTEAIHIPYGQLAEQVVQKVPSKHMPIVLCSMGNGRAARALETLVALGYSDIRYLEGGYSGYCERNPTGHGTIKP